ncbi:MAG: branched-chain amino acid ABC transporter permease, partial [Bosea sp. (in: a-proteobacteria)]
MTLLTWLAALAMLAMLPQVLTVKYYLHLSILALIWVIVAQGQNLIQGYTGYVSIVQAGFMGIGAYSSTLIGIHYGWPIWATIAAAPLVTAFFALLTGYPSLRVKGHYFAIVTMAFNLIIVIVLINFRELTRGEAGISNIPKPWGGDRESFFYVALVLAAMLTLLTALIAQSRLGEILKAIRQNEDLVGAIGIAAWKYKLFAFVISAMYAGLGGALYAH